MSLTWFTNHLKLVFWWINIFCRCLCFHHHNNILFVNCPVAKHFGICVKEIQRKIMIFCLISISINIYRFSLQPVSLIKSAKMITLVLKFHTLNISQKTYFCHFWTKKKKIADDYNFKYYLLWIQYFDRYIYCTHIKKIWNTIIRLIFVKKVSKTY